MTFEKSRWDSWDSRINSRYSPTGVEPVAKPSTVGLPAALFWRIIASIIMATCRDADPLSEKTKVGMRVFGTYCDGMTEARTRNATPCRVRYAWPIGRGEGVLSQ